MSQTEDLESIIQPKSLPAFMEAFLNDPKTVKMKRPHRTHYHVAILMKRGKILSQATNRVGSRSRGVGYSELTIHAERNCVKQLGDTSLLRGADMYIMRISENNTEFKCSKPCSECKIFLEKCMREYGLKNVYYTS
jgi:hypothetical protein